MTSNKKILLIILDGWGIAETWGGNAISMANTKAMDSLKKTYPNILLEASGEAVGLPFREPGNSEVGHQNIGSGQAAAQDLSSINTMIKNGTFFQNPTLKEIFEKAKQKGTLHLIGLLSDGGIHSHINHLISLLTLAQKMQLNKVNIHVITDGRDSSPTSAPSFLAQLEETIKDSGIGKIASISGRYYAMDRDENWDRIEQFYDVITGQTTQNDNSAEYIVKNSYAGGITDEFIKPTLLKKDLAIADGDSVIFFNYRTDRMRQIARAFAQKDFAGFKRKRVLKNLTIGTFSSYQEGLPVKVIFNNLQNVHNPLSEILSSHGLTHLHAAETEKYAHVTYFFNGGVEKPFKGERRILVPSPNVKTYDLKPEMSAEKISTKVIDALENNPPDFSVVNFANADMVGHTGNFEAAVKAVETVDRSLGKIVKSLSKHYIIMVTADHGNAEQMINPVTALPDTEHTNNPVPFIYLSDNNQNIKLRESGKLCDIAPTVLGLLDIAKPKTITGQNLLK